MLPNPLCGFSYTCLITSCAVILSLNIDRRKVTAGSGAALELLRSERVCPAKIARLRCGLALWLPHLRFPPKKQKHHGVTRSNAVTVAVVTR